MLENVEETELKEKNKTGFLAGIEQPDILLSYLAGLTELEQQILSIVFQENKALTIQRIRSILIVRTITIHKIDLPNWLKELYFNFPFKSYNILNEKKAEEYINKLKSKELSFRELEKELKIPSFDKVMRVISDLVGLNILIERKDGLRNKKIRGLYFLNPQVRALLEKKKQELMSKYSTDLEKHKKYIDNLNLELIKMGSPIMFNY